MPPSFATPPDQVRCHHHVARTTVNSRRWPGQGKNKKARPILFAEMGNALLNKLNRAASWSYFRIKYAILSIVRIPLKIKIKEMGSLQFKIITDSNNFIFMLLCFKKCPIFQWANSVYLNYYCLWAKFLLFIILFKNLFI